MNVFERKILWRVLGIHGALILLLITVPMLRGCFKPKPKEIEIFISVADAAPAVDVAAVENLPEPMQPKVETKDPIPEPVKPKKVEPPKPKRVEPPKPKKVEPPKPKKEEPPKPKWEPKKASEIKKGKKINEPKKPPPPAITTSDIKKMFSGLQSSASSAVSPAQFNDYYLQVYNRLYAAWTPPSAASAATRPTEVKIYMQKNGQITKRAKTEGSGDPLYDRTVMDAVNSITTLPKPPVDYPFDYVIVTFRIIE
ncbi:MAG: TonB C-terminal domain-containing protein [Kiritimatiellales bacterium]|nr:TonB C-terminal domain-containing protein [Kiritimatiellales bacterium]